MSLHPSAGYRLTQLGVSGGARVGDLFPRLTLRLIGSTVAGGRRKQRRIAKKVAAGTWPPRRGRA